MISIVINVRLSFIYKTISAKEMLQKSEILSISSLYCFKVTFRPCVHDLVQQIFRCPYKVSWTGAKNNYEEIRNFDLWQTFRIAIHHIKNCLQTSLHIDNDIMYFYWIKNGCCYDIEFITLNMHLSEYVCIIVVCLVCVLQSYGFLLNVF